MSDLTKSITFICQHLIKKDINVRTETEKECYKAIQKAKKNPNVDQEIISDEITRQYYLNIKNSIWVSIYKQLCLEFNVNGIDKEVLKSLDKKRQIIQHGNWYYVAMKTWDIEINLNNSAISKKISENEFVQKNKAIIKWEDCFLQEVSPGWKDGERYNLIMATQEDLKAILSWLTELL